MSTSRPPKKSETLEIRIPYSTKAAFMAQCRRDGSSASEALRTLIEQRLKGEAAPQRRPSSWVSSPRKALHLLAGALFAAAVGAIAVPSLAHPVCTFRPGAWPSIGTTQSTATATRDAQLRAQFARIDADHDGKMSFDEFRRRREAVSTEP